MSKEKEDYYKVIDSHFSEKYFMRVQELLLKFGTEIFVYLDERFHRKEIMVSYQIIKYIKILSKISFIFNIVKKSPITQRP